MKKIITTFTLIVTPSGNSAYNNCGPDRVQPGIIKSLPDDKPRA